MHSKQAVEEITKALTEEYMGVGSTPKTAFESLVDDMINNRIDTESLECTESEIIMAIGNLLNHINVSASEIHRHELSHIELRRLRTLNFVIEALNSDKGPSEKDWWWGIR